MKKQVLPSYDDVQSEMLPLIGFEENYKVHAGLGKIYNVSKGKWLLVDAKGVGDKGYLMTRLKNNQGQFVPVYEHEVVMAASLGVLIKSWRNPDLFGYVMEVDHIDRNVKNNSLENLQLVSRKQQYTESVLNDMRPTGKRLDKDAAEDIRKEFINWDGRKIAFYQMMADKYGVCKRTIQNLILGISFKTD